MSFATDSIGTKQPIRRLEIPINKFNDVAIPHHLDLLRRHKNNIKRYQKLRDWELVRKEQVNAGRLVRQLEQLLFEIDGLRAQVQDDDIAKFDKLTAKSRESTIAAIKEYLELRFEPPSTVDSAPESPKEEDQTPKDPLEERYVQLHAEQEELERQHACLHAWNSLQRDLHQLHQLFVDFNQMIHDQRERVDKAETDVIESQVNVETGTTYLKKAARYKAAAYPIAGALLGTCLGGPVGLIAGLKLGGLTAIGGGLLGFTGATLLKKRQREIEHQSELLMIKAREDPTEDNLDCSVASLQQDESKDLKKSL